MNDDTPAAQSIPVTTVTFADLLARRLPNLPRRRSTWVGPVISRREQQRYLDRVGLDQDDLDKYGSGYEA